MDALWVIGALPYKVLMAVAFVSLQRGFRWYFKEKKAMSDFEANFYATASAAGLLALFTFLWLFYEQTLW